MELGHLRISIADSKRKHQHMWIWYNDKSFTSTTTKWHYLWHGQEMCFHNYSLRPLDIICMIFPGVVTPHSCRAGPNQTLTESVPLEYDVTTDTHVYSACHQYVDLAVDNRTEPCTRGWHYDPLYFTPETGTIAMEVVIILIFILLNFPL